MNTLRLMLVTTFGLGFLRPAPGTWGSTPPPALVAVLLFAGAAPGAPGAPFGAINASLLLVLIVFSAACLRWGLWAESRFQRKDPSHVVADETAGQCLPLLFLPAEAFMGPPIWGGALGGLTWRGVATLVTAFLLFRIMDIVKPPPARGLQRLGGGLGVLIDDLFAGAYAAIFMQLLTRLALPHVTA